jgi:AGZA family xanthine/uracil permease-like MFS transporter
MSTSALARPLPRWITRGDVDGFFGLALDNLVQLLLIAALCRGVLGFDDALLYGRVLPAAGVSLLIGNLWYARQARRLMRESGRDDICALPFGINTVSVFAHVFLVMLPAKLAAQAAGAVDPARIAWQAGLLACFGSGLIEFCGAFVAESVRRATPRAALLATLAGIALSFIALGFVFRVYAHPVVGLATLALILAGYFGRVRLRGGIPTGAAAVILGIALCWLTGLAPAGAMPGMPELRLPGLALADLAASLRGDWIAAYLGVIVAMGAFNVIGSMQNLESAAAAGDVFPTRSSLAVNGIATLVASGCGSCFPTTLYIGHPGWKAMGARAGYSAMSGLFLALLCFTGSAAWVAWAVPVDAGMAIILWIGLVITAQAFQATPRAHAPAVAVGLLPGIAAWGAFMAKAGVRAGGGTFSDALVPAFDAGGVSITGAFALEQGAIFTAMILAAMTVALIERRFSVAAAWCASAALISATGLMHAFRYTQGDTALALTPAWNWAIGYAVMAVIFLLLRVFAVPVDSAASDDGAAH